MGLTTTHKRTRFTSPPEFFAASSVCGKFMVINGHYFMNNSKLTPPPSPFSNVEMGDFFIEGVGDEVVLFGGFLALSVVFLTVAALWQRQGGEPNHDRNARPEEFPQAPQVAQTEREEEHTQNTTESDGLRHRFTAAPSRGTTNVDSPSTRSEELRQDVAEDEEGEADGRDHEDAEMTIRLVRAGMPGHPLEVRVTPSCTIDQLRQ